MTESYRENGKVKRQKRQRNSIFDTFRLYTRRALEINKCNNKCINNDYEKSDKYFPYICVFYASWKSVYNILWLSFLSIRF